MTLKTVRALQKMHQDNQKIVMLTCYDATFAALCDECEVDILLVGDSLGMVLQGHQTTLSVSMDQMVYHIQCVARGNKNAMILADMPFATFQQSPQTAFENAAKLIAAGAHMVKLEGGQYLYETIRFLTERGIPVCAHIGLTPQSVNVLGGFTVQGKTPEAGQRLIEDALACQQAGANLLLLEAIPAELAQTVTERLSVPTIGIGAGPHCSGQVLVLYDILGIGIRTPPKFVKNFMAHAHSIQEAISAYVTAVKSVAFPEEQHCFKKAPK